MRLLDILSYFPFHLKWNEVCLVLINVIYELLHELPNDLKLIRYQENMRKIKKRKISKSIYLPKGTSFQYYQKASLPSKGNIFSISPKSQSTFQREHPFNISKKLPKNRNWTFPAVRYFTRKLEFVSNILSMAVDL